MWLVFDKRIDAIEYLNYIARVPLQYGNFEQP